MKLKESENEIVLTDTPVIFWTLGTFLLVACLVSFVSFYYYLYQRFQTLLIIDTSIITLWVCFIFLLILFASMILVEKVTVKVNRQDKFVEIRRTRLLKKQVDRYFFSQVSHFYLIKRPQNGLEQIGLTLANDSRINLEIGNKANKVLTNTIKRLNSFITK